VELIDAFQVARTFTLSADGDEFRLVIPEDEGELSFGPAPQAASIPLEDTVWSLISYQDGKSVLPETEITATFDDGALFGSAGCNDYRGSYELDGQSLAVSPVAMTRKACAGPAGVMEQEQAYGAALASVAGYRIQGERLELLDAGAVVVATFGARPSVGSEIVGVTWRWQGTQTPVEQIAVDAPERYTLELLPDGRVSVQADCNRVGGTYALTASQLELSLTTSTKAACPPDSQSDRYIRDLGAAVIYFMEGGELFLDLKFDSGTMRFAPSD
jgi:heat shock protein HslJ